MTVHVLVVTVVHTPLDARILHRQIRALLEAGHHVTYAAPFSDHRVPPSKLPGGVVALDVPRAMRYRRLRALRVVRRVLRTAGSHADVIVLHDPELLVAAVLAHVDTPIVWDVHEDLAASLDDKDWIPAPLRGLFRQPIRWFDRWAERRWHLLLAEEGYRDRFRFAHPVVPNLPWLPPEPGPPGTDRVVYLGRVSVLRGARELLALGARLAERGIVLEVIGAIDAPLADAFDEAARAGHVRVTGFVPNDRALDRLAGALAGISLLHDHPNYRHSRPTKLVEYAAAGLPVVTTPLPPAAAFVEDAGCGTVVPFGDVEAAEAAIVELAEDRDRARQLGRAGRFHVERHASWDAVVGDFVASLEQVAGANQPRP